MPSKTAQWIFLAGKSLRPGKRLRGRCIDVEEMDIDIVASGSFEALLLVICIEIIEIQTQLRR